MTTVTHAGSQDAAQLTSHHALKIVALLIMTIDHVGAYLYPEMLWLRAIGRVTFPVWFFLVGHALHYRIHRDVVLWAAVLLFINPLLGQPLFPLNALVTIIACQWVLQYVETHDWLKTALPTMLAACVVLLLPSFLLSEYGVLGFLYALMGYAVRRQQMTWRTGKLVAVLALVMFLVMMHQIFEFSTLQLLWVIAATALVTWHLAHFTHRPILLFKEFPRVAKAMLYWSRHSLQYYVVHRVVLQAAGLLMGVVAFGFQWF